MLLNHSKEVNVAETELRGEMQLGKMTGASHGSFQAGARSQPWYVLDAKC